MTLRVEDFSAADMRELPNAPRSGQRTPSRREPFLKGPVPLSWLAKAASLRKPALPAGICLWFHRGVSGQTRIRVSGSVRKKLGLSAGQMLRGLRALSKANLIRFEKSGRGRCAVVEIVEPASSSKEGL
jgi:hypothetical protein